ncbi:uracil-DNA glycosylase-like protein [Mycena vitilis]|nr:uracil-DNA glycosylase-like protein [Mycena vitilis]
MKEEANDNSLGSLDQFRSSLSQFSFEKTELRRSPRKPVPNRSRKTKTASPERSLKKQKRSYAPPETYAHLRELQDHLKPDLDVIFCGINPGKKSAEIGHHFGNPSNHFWWCLHNSGFTPSQLPPQEDFLLPDRFSLGLTNLVDRPTTEQVELSSSEQLASVPQFLAKIARYRPRVVCFVGLSIARVVDASLNVTMDSGAKSWGLRPYKMVHRSPSAFAETLFFASPSTSGLVTQFKRPDKARIFGELRQIVENMKAGDASISAAVTVVIQPDQIAFSPELLSFAPVEQDSKSTSPKGERDSAAIPLSPSREGQ